VGLLIGRSYLLSGNTAYYDGVIAAFERAGVRVIPAFASALDSRPAIERFFMNGAGAASVDAVVSLTGFSLVGGPAYNDAAGARELLGRLDVPYVVAQALEFQSVQGWENDQRGLNALQATLQVAIPELDGATNPMVLAGRSAQAGEASRGATAPLPERVDLLVRRVRRLMTLRATPRAERRLAITLFNFPPNAGNTGTAAYLDVFTSLFRTLESLRDAGYSVEVPASVDALRHTIIEGNRAQYGTPANVHGRVSVEDHVRSERHLRDVEAVWGPAPGRQLTDGRHLFVMGASFGHVFVGVQPAFGWEGDPMRLLFEGTFAPTHAFCAYYRWVRETFGAHAVLHFGTHGALEFMPGKQVGLGSRCWPERLIDDLPNIYLYASNNSAEGTLAKRRSAATLVSYLTPPITQSGLYADLATLKATLDRYRGLPPADVEGRQAALSLLCDQASRVDLSVPADEVANDPERAVLRLDERLREVEFALIPNGLHILGHGLTDDERRDTLRAMATLGRPELDLPPLVEAIAGPDARGEARLRAERGVERVIDELIRRGSAAWARDALASDGWVRHTMAVEPSQPAAVVKLIEELARINRALRENGEIDGLLRALDGRYVPPAPGGDLMRMPAVLPTGRNLYAFDPFRVPSALAVHEGQRRASQLVAKYQADHGELPASVAFALWGSDNLKSEGTPLAQVLALLGAVPRFDSVGRLCGARLIPLAQLGRPRIDTVVSVSGIFRDLLPLQVRLLADAALLAASADEPESQNFVRRHALQAMRETGCDLATAALRVFGNDEGAYGSNVNLVVDAGTWRSDEELATLFARRKGFAYGTDGRAHARAGLFERTLQHTSLSFQNIDSLELGTLDVDQYVEALGGLSRLATRARGSAVPAYVGDHTGKEGKVRELSEQVAFETRTRTVNPRWIEGQLRAGHEGVRNIANRLTVAVGWSATTRSVPDWVYQEVARTFVLDPAMRDRLAQLNTTATAGMTSRLIEATDRGLWTPDAETLAALRAAADELEDQIEGIHEPPAGRRAAGGET
jgi:magnesium chelatase subunit H